MTDRLKEHIQSNRSAFDVLEAPDLWTGITAGMKATSPVLSSKIIKLMVRYGFGISVVAAATVVGMQYLQIGAEKPQTAEVIEIPALPKQKPVPPAAAQMPVPAPSPTQLFAFPAPVSQVPAPYEPQRVVEEEIAPPAEMPVELTPAISGGTCTVIDTVFDGVRRLVVHGEACNIRINGHKDKSVAVTGTMTSNGANRITMGKKGWKDADYILRYQRNGEVLRLVIEEVKLDKKVKVECDEESPNVLDLKVPDGIMISVNNHMGNLTAGGITSDSTHLSADYGNIRITQGSGNFVLYTKSGNIAATDFTGNLEADSKFGNQKYEQIKGKLDAETSSGNLTVKTLTGVADVMTKFGNQVYENIEGPINSMSQSGNVRISAQKGDCVVKTQFGHQEFNDVAGNVRASAHSGNITITGVTGKLDLQTKFGNISGREVNLNSDSHFESHSGNINMTITNTLAELRFDLTASSGKIEVEKDNTVNKSDDALQVGDGKILVRGVSKFGGQKYR
jgi:hypothetical protein